MEAVQKILISVDEFWWMLLDQFIFWNLKEGKNVLVNLVLHFIQLDRVTRFLQYLQLIVGTEKGE